MHRGFSELQLGVRDLMSFLSCNRLSMPVWQVSRRKKATRRSSTYWIRAEDAGQDQTNYTGTVHTKQSWLLGWIGTKKKSLQRLMTEKLGAYRKMLTRIVWGTTGKVAIISLFVILRCYTKCHLLLYHNFWMRKIEVLLLVITIIACFKNTSVVGLIPSLASGFKGYCIFLVNGFVFFSQLEFKV